MKPSQPKRVLTCLAFLLAVGGLAVSGVLLQHHVATQIHSDPLLGQLCNPTASASCDDVLASKWGKFEWHDAKGNLHTIPTAAVGIGYFALVAAWFIVVGMPTGRRRWLHIVPTMLTLGGLLGAIGFEYIMFGVLGKYCPLCMATHAAILLLTIVTLLMWRRGHATQMQPTIAGAPAEAGSVVLPSHPSCRLLLATLLLAAAVTGTAWYKYRAALANSYANEYLARWQDYNKDVRVNYDKWLAQPYEQIAITPEDPVFGPPDSKFTVVVFSDFLCPACQALEITVIEERLKEFPGQFRVVFKHYPLDTTCNKNISTTMHPGACAAAVAAEAAFILRGNDAFWTLHHDYFHNKSRFTSEFIYQQAEKLGINRDEYMGTINRFSTWERIRRDVAEGARLKIESTPAIFLNGRQLKSWGDRHLWQYLLSDETLAATPASQPASQPTTQSASAPSVAATKHE